jgi:cytochrome b pre-mRNA-processing protein 3
MFAQFARWFSPSPELDQAHQLYIALVNQARQPIFYAEFGVPDSLDGRFEMILIHLFLLTQRLNTEENAEYALLAQRVTECFFNDMDRSLREIGVGDMSVGKRVKAMANAYNGRLTVYAQAVDDQAALHEALRRNAYGTVKPSETQIKTLAHYIMQSLHGLKKQPVEAITATPISWPLHD